MCACVKLLCILTEILALEFRHTHTLCALHKVKNNEHNTVHCVRTNTNECTRRIVLGLRMLVCSTSMSIYDTAHGFTTTSLAICAQYNCITETVIMYTCYMQ